MLIIILLLIIYGARPKIDSSRFFFFNRIRDKKEFTYQAFIDQFYHTERSMIDICYATVLDMLIAQRCDLSEFAVEKRAEISDRHNPNSEYHEKYMTCWKNRYKCDQELRMFRDAKKHEASTNEERLSTKFSSNPSLFKRKRDHF